MWSGETTWHRRLLWSCSTCSLTPILGAEGQTAGSGIMSYFIVTSTALYGPSFLVRSAGILDNLLTVNQYACFSSSLALSRNVVLFVTFQAYCCADWDKLEAQMNSPKTHLLLLPCYNTRLTGAFPHNATGIGEGGSLTLSLARVKGGGSMRPPEVFLRCTPNYEVDRAEISHSLWGILCATFGKKKLTGSCQVTEL